MRNIFKEGELDKNSVWEKFAYTASDEKELRAMGQLVSGYTDFVERQAEREIPMTMEHWAKYLDGILISTGKNLLMENETVSHLQAGKRLRPSIKSIRQKLLAVLKRIIWKA